jgi:hypothetical protein
VRCNADASTLFNNLRSVAKHLETQAVRHPVLSIPSIAWRSIASTCDANARQFLPWTSIEGAPHDRLKWCVSAVLR